MKCKPLVCFGNAYDCEPVIKAFNKLSCDKLRLDYVEYPKNFLEAQKFFLEHSEYTHFVYLAPDLVITPNQFNELIKMVEAYDYDVYGPVCNMDEGKYKDKLGCCLKLPDIEFNTRNYRWIQEEARQYFLNEGLKTLSLKFNGLCFCFIKRQILENYTFSTLPYQTDEKPIWETRGGYACDLAFCHYCDFENIPILVDLRIKLLHLRYFDKLQVGLKTPKMTFIPHNKYTKYGRQNSPKSKIPSSS